MPAPGPSAARGRPRLPGNQPGADLAVQAAAAGLHPRAHSPRSPLRAGPAQYLLGPGDIRVHQRQLPQRQAPTTMATGTAAAPAGAAHAPASRRPGQPPAGLPVASPPAAPRLGSSSPPDVGARDAQSVAGVGAAGAALLPPLLLAGGLGELGLPDPQEEARQARRRHRKRVARIVVDHWKRFAGERLRMLAAARCACIRAPKCPYVDAAISALRGSGQQRAHVTIIMHAGTNGGGWRAWRWPCGSRTWPSPTATCGRPPCTTPCACSSDWAAASRWVGCVCWLLRQASSAKHPACMGTGGHCCLKGGGGGVHRGMEIRGGCGWHTCISGYGAPSLCCGCCSLEMPTACMLACACTRLSLHARQVCFLCLPPGVACDGEAAGNSPEPAGARDGAEVRAPGEGCEGQECAAYLTALVSVLLRLQPMRSQHYCGFENIYVAPPAAAMPRLAQHLHGCVAVQRRCCRSNGPSGWAAAPSPASPHCRTLCRILAPALNLHAHT